MTKQSNARKSKAICSFCGRSGNQADTLIEGPDDVFICPECVELCHNIIKQNRRQVDGRRTEVSVATAKTLKSVTLDAGIYADANPGDNTWAADKAGSH